MSPGAVSSGIGFVEQHRSLTGQRLSFGISSLLESDEPELGTDLGGKILILYFLADRQGLLVFLPGTYQVSSGK